MGAGARAVGNGSTGNQGFGVDEDFGRDPAGVVFTTRTGLPAGDGLVYMPIADTIEANDEELYGAEPGLLGDELADGGHRARRRSPTATAPIRARPTPVRRRGGERAVAALMTSAGKVPGGRVDDGLLRQDAAAPFGVRLDPDRGGAAPSPTRGSPARSCWSRAPTSCGPTSRRGSRRTSRR